MEETVDPWKHRRRHFVLVELRHAVAPLITNEALALDRFTKVVVVSIREFRSNVQHGTPADIW